MVTSDDKMYKTLKQELLSQKDRQGIPSTPLRQFIRCRPTAKFPLRHRYFYRFTVISKRYFLQSRIHAGIRHCKDGLSCHRLYHYGTRFRSCKRHTAGLQAIVARIEHRLQQFFVCRLHCLYQRVIPQYTERQPGGRSALSRIHGITVRIIHGRLSVVNLQTENFHAIRQILLTGICFVVQHPVRRTRFAGYERFPAVFRKNAVSKLPLLHQPGCVLA